MPPATTLPKLDVVTVHGDCEESVSEVSVRVVAFQMSDAMPTADVSVRPLNAQTVDGIELIAEASDVDAFITSDWSAIEPVVSVASVSAREPKLQICAAVRAVELAATNELFTSKFVAT